MKPTCIFSVSVLRTSNAPVMTVYIYMYAGAATLFTIFILTLFIMKFASKKRSKVRISASEEGLGVKEKNFLLSQHLTSSFTKREDAVNAERRQPEGEEVEVGGNEERSSSGDREDDGQTFSEDHITEARQEI